MTERFSVLFVCLGNICRSPMAEGAFRAAALRASLDVECDSAGTGDWHIGKAPDPRAQAEMLRHGIDISGLKARQIDESDYRRFTHIFALDAANLSDIRLRAPEDATAEIGLLMDCVSAGGERSVTDPYFGGDEGFSETWHDVSEAAEILARTLAAGR